MPIDLVCPKDAQSHRTFKGLENHVCVFVVDLDCHGEVGGKALDTIQELLTHYAESDVLCATCGAVARRANQIIPFTPGAGMMLICDFSLGFKAPEMVKPRPVVVVSEREQNYGTCIVVPISTVAPLTNQKNTVPLSNHKYPFLGKDSWAKCDVVNSVRLGRLLRLRDPVSGRRIDTRSSMIDPADLLAIRVCTARSLGLTVK